jgi:hypothetical protein
VEVEAEVGIVCGDSSGGTSEVEVEVTGAEAEAVAEVEAEVAEAAEAEVAETEGCIRGGSMSQRYRHASEVAACIRGSQNSQKLSELVRTEWYLSGVTSAACRT